MPFYPGPGLGGHCIPIDPFYLTWQARAYGFQTRFIELAGEINSYMPQYVVDQLAQILDKHKGLGLSQAKILVIGAAYKKDVDDTRESPALEVLQILKHRQASISYHDPWVPRIPQTRAHAELAGMESVPIAGQHRPLRRGFDRDRPRAHQLARTGQFSSVGCGHTQRDEQDDAHAR
jgi:UDP-N-acetyl-D-glucosamine dehydrogenase